MEFLLWFISVELGVIATALICINDTLKNK